MSTSGTLMPQLFLTALDSAGVSLSGAKLYAYEAGTTTPVNTFSDVALTTANANPVIADSAGRFGDIYLTPGVSYKFKLTTSADATIRTVDNVLSVPGSSNPVDANEIANLRLTLTSGTPVTTADVTGATTVYIEPYRGNRIALYDGAAWNLREVTATSFAVPATTSTMYDVFAYDNSGTPAYETLAWTNDTTRATALTTQNGVLSKTGALTRRYLGSFRTTTVSGQTEDSAAKRYVWNYTHRVPRPMRVVEATASWAYTTATLRQARATATNQLDFIIGVSDTPVSAAVKAFAGNATANVLFSAAIGLDSTTAVATDSTAGTGVSQGTNDGYAQAAIAEYRGFPGVGRHYLAWLEWSVANGTTTWLGLGTNPHAQAGITGVIEG